MTPSATATSRRFNGPSRRNRDPRWRRLQRRSLSYSRRFGATAAPSSMVELGAHPLGGKPRDAFRRKHAGRHEQRRHPGDAAKQRRPIGDARRRRQRGAHAGDIGVGGGAGSRGGIGSVSGDAHRFGDGRCGSAGKGRAILTVSVVTYRFSATRRFVPEKGVQVERDVGGGLVAVLRLPGQQLVDDGRQASLT